MQMWKMRGRRRNRMWDVRLVLALAFVTALFVAATVFYLGWGVLGVDKVKKEKAIDASTLFDLVKLAFGVVAGAGALVALIVAYRRQRIDEDGALREHTRLHTERFTTAVTQLGDASPAVKLGGVHALAGLADDAPTPQLRQTCVDVLCAFLRLPYRGESDLPPDDEVARHEYLALREVRHTVIRLIRDHLRLDPEHPHSWHGIDLDFTGVVFDGGDFSGAQFVACTVRFSDATFASGNISFAGARVHQAFLDFGEARFTGAFVDFGGVQLEAEGALGFPAARITDGTISFSKVSISRSANISFLAAKFRGGLVQFFALRDMAGRLFFDWVVFEAGRLFFDTVKFNGLISFEHAQFLGDPDSPNGPTNFSGYVMTMIQVAFSGGEVNFNHANLEPHVIAWQSVRYGAGVVKFDTATGHPPDGLLHPSRPPDTVTIPTEWESLDH